MSMSASTIVAAELPFTLSNDGAAIVLVLLPAAGLHAQLAYRDSVAWAEDRQGSNLIIDWTHQPRGSAMLAAWMLHLIQVLRPPQLVLRHVSPAVRETLTRYHLAQHACLYGCDMRLED